MSRTLLIAQEEKKKNPAGQDIPERCTTMSSPVAAVLQFCFGLGSGLFHLLHTYRHSRDQTRTDSL